MTSVDRVENYLPIYVEELELPGRRITSNTVANGYPRCPREGCGGKVYLKQASVGKLFLLEKERG